MRKMLIAITSLSGINGATAFRIGMLNLTAH